MFRVLFDYNQADPDPDPDAGSGLGDLRVSAAELPGVATAKFDLRLILGEDGDALAGAVHFSTELF